MWIQNKNTCNSSLRELKMNLPTHHGFLLFGGLTRSLCRRVWYNIFIDIQVCWSFGKVIICEGGGGGGSGHRLPWWSPCWAGSQSHPPCFLVTSSQTHLHVLIVSSMMYSLGPMWALFLLWVWSHSQVVCVSHLPRTCRLTRTDISKWL